MERLARGRRPMKKCLRISQNEKKRKSISKPSERWLDDVKYVLKKMVVRGWRKHLGIKMRVT
jgi:hypothetical protein